MATYIKNKSQQNTSHIYSCQERQGCACTPSIGKVPYCFIFHEKCNLASINKRHPIQNMQTHWPTATLSGPKKEKTRIYNRCMLKKRNQKNLDRSTEKTLAFSLPFLSNKSLHLTNFLTAGWISSKATASFIFLFCLHPLYSSFCLFSFLLINIHFMYYIFCMFIDKSS